MTCKVASQDTGPYFLQQRMEPSLETLPDELISSVVLRFQLLRKYHSTTHGVVAAKDETTRKEQNRTRQRTLIALCRTSRRISRIATPVLYSSIIIDLSARPQRLPTSLLLGTLITNPRLADNIRYIENRIEDVESSRYSSWSLTSTCCINLIISKKDEAWGTGRLGDTWYRWYNSHPIQAEVALLIALATNVRHLYLATTERGAPSIWDFLRQRLAPPEEVEERPPSVDDPEGVTRMGGVLRLRRFDRLETLCVEVDGGDYADSGYLYQEIDDHLFHLQKLRYFHTSGLRIKALSPAWEVQSLPIQSIYLSKVKADLCEICNLVRACCELKHFACHYKAVTSNDHELRLDELRKALELHTSSLKSLSLDVRRVTIGESTSVISNIYPLGDLRGFTALRSVMLDTTSLFGDPLDFDIFDSFGVRGYWNHCRPPMALSSLVPADIESMTLIPSEPLDADSQTFCTLVPGDSSFPVLEETVVSIEAGHFGRLRELRVAFAETTTGYTSARIAELRERLEKRCISLDIRDEGFSPYLA